MFLSLGVGSYDCRYGFEQVAGDINAHNIIQISATTDACLALSGAFWIFSASVVISSLAFGILDK